MLCHNMQEKNAPKLHTVYQAGFDMGEAISLY